MISSGPAHHGWISAISSASKSTDRAYQYIVGGELSGTLEAIGDAFFESSIDHLRQASHSPSPRERVVQAASAMQDAYFLYNKSTDRGVRALRRIVNLRQLSESRVKAAGCALSIPLMQWYLEEAPENIATWLGRGEHQLRAYDEDVEASMKVNPYTTLDVTGLQLSLAETAYAYFRLEANLLPEEMRLPMPLGYYSEAELVESGRIHDRNQRPTNERTGTLSRWKRAQR